MNEKEYIRSLFVKEDNILQSVEIGLKERGLPQISVPREVGKTLFLLVKIAGAKKIVEIGALAGYSTIWLARALPSSGRLLSIELDEEHAKFAQENVDQANLHDQVQFHIGDASEKLDQLIQEKELFDFFFIDADKPNYLKYLEQAIQLSTPGALIIADNLFQGGRVFDFQDKSPSPVAIREFNQKIASDSRLESMILPIGDGLGICRVKNI